MNVSNVEVLPWSTGTVWYAFFPFYTYYYFFLGNILDAHLITRPNMFWLVDLEVTKDLCILCKPFPHIRLIGSYGPSNTKLTAFLHVNCGKCLKRPQAQDLPSFFYPKGSQGSHLDSQTVTPRTSPATWSVGNCWPGILHSTI